MRRLQAQADTEKQVEHDMRSQVDELLSLKVKLQTVLRRTFEEEKKLVAEVDALKANTVDLKSQLEEYKAENTILEKQLVGERAQATAREETMNSLHHERSQFIKPASQTRLLQPRD